MSRQDGRFTHVFDENVSRIYAFFGYRVASRPDAEDLTQQTFERALRAWERFDPDRASAQTWLLSIARNLLIDHYRRAGPERQFADPSEIEAAVGHAPSPEAALGLEPELEAALGTLDERARELVALRFGGDLNGPEIAALTGLSLANVQQIISRTLRALRKQLDPPRPPRTQPAENGPRPAIPRATTASSSPPEPA